MNFSHLHVHTDASKIDGLGAIDSQVVNGQNVPGLVEVAKHKGFEHLAITDHGTLSNTVSFVVTCKRFGVKPIVGLEGYLQDANEIFHITLLADGQKGFSNLVKLNNQAMLSDTRRPSFTLDELKKYSENVICLSGCPASPLQALDWKAARRIGLFLKNAFKDRFFAELMFVQNDFPSWERSIQISKDLKIPLVVTNDVHFSEKEKAYSSTILKRIKAPYLEYDSSQLWLATGDELVNRINQWGLTPYLTHLAEGMQNAYNIAERVESIVLDPTPSLPHIENADMELDRAVFYQLGEKIARPGDDVGWDLGRPFVGYPKEYDDRVDFELDTIKDMDFSSYFIILKDIIDYAKSKGIMIGPGRGSGAGSLILYLLGITDIDPLEYGLSFERFLNPQRKEMPDVDIDIPTSARQEILDYASEKWGAVPIATYGRYDEKSLIQEIVKVLGYSVSTKLAASAGGYDGDVTQNIIKEHPEFNTIYRDMFGQIRNASKHAGGVVIAKPDDDIPLERTKDDKLIAGWTEGHNRELSEAGLVKFDFLGLKALDILSILKKKHGNPEKPVDHSPIFDLFKTGNTTGIFQFDTRIMHNLSLDIQPDTFADLTAQVALKLPGPLNAGTTEHYVEYKVKPRTLHPFIDDILEETYGIICYQEQFMQLYARVTDGDLSEADFARKIIVKAKPGDVEWEYKYEKLKNNFISGCIKHSIPYALAVDIWNEIDTHSRYSFNKAHATSYAMISWNMAYYKYHYPADFYAALLTVHGDNPDKVEEYIFAAVQDGVEIVPPNVNHSTLGYESDGGKIYMALTSVKFLAEVAAQEIIDNRPYVEYDDFVSKVQKRKVNKRIKKGLYALNAFNGLSQNDGKHPKDVLGIDVEDFEDKTPNEIQQEYLGHIIPTKHLFELIRDCYEKGQKAGIIKDVEEKESKYGKFWRFNLLPRDSVWTRNDKLLQALTVGSLIAVSVSDYGKILQVHMK